MSRYLSKMQVDDYRRLGYLQPVALLDEPRATALRAAVIDHLAVDSTAERYELTDDVKVGISSRTGDSPTDIRWPSLGPWANSRRRKALRVPAAVLAVQSGSA